MRRLLLPLLALPLVAPLSAQTFSGGPSDDLWVYGHATDPGADPIMRVWGDGTTSYLPTWPPNDNLSHGYLRFDLGSISPGAYQVTSAKLIVTHRVTTSGTFTREVGEANPLEARALGNTFTEGTWDFNNSSNPAPGDLLYGKGDLSNYNPGASFEITIDLLGAAFQNDFNAIVNSADKHLAIALTSTMPVTGQQGALPYRIFSRDHIVAAQQPRLEVSFQAVPEPTTLAATAGLAVLALKRRRRK